MRVQPQEAECKKIGNDAGPTPGIRNKAGPSPEMRVLPQELEENERVLAQNCK